MCRQVRFAKQQASSTNLDGEAKGGNRKAPLSPLQRRKPLLSGKGNYGRKTSYSVAPIRRDTALMLERAAWGRSCGSAKLLAGTLRCLRLCWRFPWNWSSVELLGRCPKPHKGRCPLTLQGEIFPLTPFARLSWFLYHTPSACCALGVLPTITPRALPLPPPHPSPDSAGTARLPPDAGRDASSRYYRPAPHGLPSPPSRLPSPRGSRFPSRRPCR